MKYEEAEMKMILFEGFDVVQALSGQQSGDDEGTDITDLDIGGGDN